MRQREEGERERKKEPFVRRRGDRIKGKDEDDTREASETKRTGNQAAREGKGTTAEDPAIHSSLKHPSSCSPPHLIPHVSRGDSETSGGGHIASERQTVSRGAGDPRLASAALAGSCSCSHSLLPFPSPQPPPMNYGSSGTTRRQLIYIHIPCTPSPLSLLLWSHCFPAFFLPDARGSSHPE